MTLDDLKSALADLAEPFRQDGLNVRASMETTNTCHGKFSHSLYLMEMPSGAPVKMLFSRICVGESELSDTFQAAREFVANRHEEHERIAAVLGFGSLQQQAAE